MTQIKPPESEESIGMGAYRSRTAGLGGVIKKSPEDFVVEEITPEGRVLEAGGMPEGSQCEGSCEYVHFTLQKCNWDTMRAIKEVAKALHVSQSRLGYAGTKDRRAVTTQRVSVWNKSIEDLRGVRIKDISLGDFECSDERIGLGALYGNRFTITLREIDLPEEEIRGRLESILSELRGMVPAYFGLQRFGEIRPVTHLVGKEILRGDLEGAVYTYLALDCEGESGDIRTARQALMESRDVKAALVSFPNRLGYEKALLNHLVQKPGDFRGAIRQLPKNLYKMFIHAYQSYIFNRALTEYLKRGIDVERLPLAGYATEVDEFTASIMESEGISSEQFRIREMPELSSKGEYRDCYVPVEGLQVLNVGADESAPGKNKAVFRFTLRKGNYATVVLREITKK